MNDETAQVRRAMVESGQPLADLQAETEKCRWCRGEIYQFEGGWYARNPEPPADNSAICREAPADAGYPRHVPGPFWDTEALQREFEVLGFMAPFVVVKRRSDGVKGSLKFTHSPRVYFGWQEDSGG